MCVVLNKFIGEELTAGEEVHTHAVFLSREQNDIWLLDAQMRFSLSSLSQGKKKITFFHNNR